MPRERGRLAQTRRLLRDRVTAERAEVEGHLVGVSENDLHVRDRDIELVGDDLRERGANPLAEVDLSRKRDHGSISLDADPLLEPLGVTTVPHQDEDAAFWTALIARP